MDGFVMKKSIVLLSILLFIGIRPGYAFDDAAFCAEMRDIAAARNAEIETAIDKVTTTGETVVACPEKRVVSNLRIGTGKGDLKDDAARVLQADWDDNFCPDEHFRDAVKNGWKLTARLTFADGQTHNLTAVCP